MKVDIYNTDKKYNIIYADPPWSYKVWSKKGMGRSAERGYGNGRKTGKGIAAMPREWQL
jgi:hypothetical protein